MSERSERRPADRATARSPGGDGERASASRGRSPRDKASIDLDIDPHPPLRYAGREERADKEFTWGTHRAMPPEQTLERIRPHLAKAGTTRVADITNLDTVGIPVAIAVRPPSATLAVESGKGATVVAALTSAAMEAIERYVSEVDDCRDVIARAADVADRLPCPVDAFPMLRSASIAPNASYEWTTMWDLVTGDEYLAPYTMVGMSAVMARHPYRGVFVSGSNGLASGNHLPEAMCAALYEVIERDATACWNTACANGILPLIVDNATLDGPVITSLIDTLDRAGVDTILEWCPVDIGVPTAMAYIVDRRRNVGVYKGYGCHLDPEIAMVRAVTEAVQGRTVFVAGARDDLLRSHFEALKRSDTLNGDEMSRGARIVSVADIPNRATASFHGDIAVMIEMLQRAGFDRVLARELDASEFEVSVVRVIVPGLEPYRFPWVAVGERARNFDPVAAMESLAA
jgi:ribosomal protein S12 methylthiotransferase accessory factor